MPNEQLQAGNQRSVAEGLSLKREIPLRSRVMIGLLDKIGLTKESRQFANDSIANSFDKIAERMGAAVENSPGWASTDAQKAESTLFWAGSAEDDPKHAIKVEYNKSEDGSTVIGIDAGPALGWMINGEPVVTPDPAYGGKTILERSPEGELGIDVDGSGHTVSLQEVGTIDCVLLAPLLDGVQQDLGNGGHEIVVPRPGQPVAA